MKKVKSFFAAFKTFITKGNVLDLAVAVIIGAAFGKIVSSLVNDIIMPLVTAAVGKNSLSELVWTLRDAVVVNGETVKDALVIKWGSFLQNIIDFLVIAFVVFVFVRTLTAAQKAAERLAIHTKDLVEKAIIHPKGEQDPAVSGTTIISGSVLPASVVADAVGIAAPDANPSSPTANTAAADIPAPAAPIAAASIDYEQLQRIEALLTDIRNSIKGK